MNLRGFPFSATFWGEVVWGRYDLTRNVIIKYDEYDNIRPHQ